MSLRAGKPHVLLLDDRTDDIFRICNLLSEDAVVTPTRTLGQATELMRKSVFDVALADAALPDVPPLAAVSSLARGALFPVIMLADVDTPELCAAAARSGAQDFLVKDGLERTQLMRSVTSSRYRHEALIQYRTLLTNCPDGVMIVTRAGTIAYANPAAITAFETELVGTTFGVPLASTDARATEIRLRSGRIAEMRVADVPWLGDPAYLVMLRDVSDRVRAVTELTKAAARLEQLSLIDPLTEVLNRRGVERMLGELLVSAVRTGMVSSAILIDCDDFKKINDTDGYSTGDAILKIVARSIVESTRNSYDHVGRIGGDEFIVLLPATLKGEALQTAERIRLTVRSNMLAFAVGSRYEQATVSLGVASIPPFVSSLNEVVGITQAALAASKRAGKNVVSSDSSGIRNLKGTIHELVLRPQLVNVAAQPIVNLSDGSLAGFELLARGPRESPFEAPEAIFCAARRENLAGTMDVLCLRRCLEAACTCDVPWVSANILPSTLLHLPRYEFEELLLAPSRPALVLELNEQEFISDPQLLLPRLRQLKEAGVLVALDDIGFGHSSIELLLGLEPDIVKIDRRAVSGIAASKDKRRMLERMLRCLNTLGPRFIAEGIETEEDGEVIRHLGIELGQGYLWGRPTLLPI